MGESTHSVKKQGRSTKTAKTRPLSEFENRILAGYFFGRDNPKQSAGEWSVPV
jgi:hypothetical protein